MTSCLYWASFVLIVVISLKLISFAVKWYQDNLESGRGQKKARYDASRWLSAWATSW